MKHVGKILKSQQEDKDLSDQNLGEGSIQRVSRAVMSLLPWGIYLTWQFKLGFSRPCGASGTDGCFKVLPFQCKGEELLVNTLSPNSLKRKSSWKGEISGSCRGVTGPSDCPLRDM